MKSFMVFMLLRKERAEGGRAERRRMVSRERVRRGVRRAAAVRSSRRTTCGWEGGRGGGAPMKIARRRGAASC